eukprot:TRINITY_DN2366_c0_g1_i1.p1 TRINITY_DN2366_c0_g1~~TRINITY_DN2366_c0_g1_i1.p1  ORF type:complete len:194 (-),score=38.87 TRINITY_DN2366_c0_g1_i1:720-1301(-)
MGWFDWFWKLLNMLGLANKSGRILFLGLDNAGKTTLLHVLKEGSLRVHKPTIHPNIEELNFGSLRLKTYDLGGHLEARRLWKDYFIEVDAIVFLIDAADKDRFTEARAELDALLQYEDLKDVPVAILGNKIDEPNAVPAETLKAAMGLQNLTTGRGQVRSGVRPLELFMCSVVKQAGYGDAFRWLSQYLRNAS